MNKIIITKFLTNVHTTQKTMQNSYDVQHLPNHNQRTWTF